MTPKLLSEYLDIVREIGDLRRELAASDRTYEKVKASMTDSPYIEMEIPVKDYGGFQRREQMRSRLKYLEGKKVSVDSFLESIDSSRMRFLIRSFYIHGMTWQQIANRINGTGGNVTADALRKTVTRYLKKNLQ